MKQHYTYMDKKNRDAKAKELRASGHEVRRYSYRNQLTHPQYVADWPGPVHTGFGNTQYKTHFAALYVVETV